MGTARLSPWRGRSGEVVRCGASPWRQAETANSGGASAQCTRWLPVSTPPRPSAAACASKRPRRSNPAATISGEGKRRPIASTARPVRLEFTLAARALDAGRMVTDGTVAGRTMAGGTMAGETRGGWSATGETAAGAPAAVSQRASRCTDQRVRKARGLSGAIMVPARPPWARWRCGHRSRCAARTRRGSRRAPPRPHPPARYTG